jgi:hypothetical protein
MEKYVNFSCHKIQEKVLGELQMLMYASFRSRFDSEANY